MAVDNTGALACIAAFPCQPSLEERGRLDGVAGLYRECARRGELMTLGQRATDVPALPAAAFETRGMGFTDGGSDVRAFRRACAEDGVTPWPSLLLRSAMAEARTVSDPAGNAKLSKGTQGGRRLRARDDAAAAAVLAVAAGVRQPAKLRPRWRYAGVA